MNVLLFGIDIENAFATNAILTNLFKLLAKEDSEIKITSIGWAPSTFENKPSENFTSFFFKNVMRTPCSRILSKVKGFLGIDNILLSWKRLYRLSRKKVDCRTFDVIMGASGHFCYMKVAYELAKRYQKRFIPLYFDPFLENVSTNAKNRSVRRKEEFKWNHFAQRIFCITDGKNFVSSQFEAKTILHPIPIFEKKHSEAKTNHIVYGGTFYKGFREPSTLDTFIKRNNVQNLEFHIYSNLKSFPSYHENVFLHGFIDNSHFSKICEECLGIIVIGNGKYTDLFPSKLVEAFSFRKPIIILNFPNLPEYFHRYPFLIENLNQLKGITEKNLSEIDLRKLFPERDPKMLIDDILNAIKAPIFESNNIVLESANQSR